MVKQKTLGSCIRFLRLQSGLTQAQLADRIGVTDKAVSKWERDGSCPDIALFPKLADILGVSVSDLVNACMQEGPPPRLLQIFDMTHDIRTPLHIIIGCAELARQHQDDPGLLEKYLNSIRVSGEYLMGSIDRLMQVAANRNEKENGEEPVPSSVQELEKSLNEGTDPDRAPARSYDFSGKRILVTDDILINREIAAGILEQTGAAVEFAENGRKCLEMITAAPTGYYDLVLMDIMMPEMDGLEATRRIRKLPDPEKAAVPVVALSANVQEMERKTAAEAGMDAFVEKPIFVDQLFETIRVHLEEKK